MARSKRIRFLASLTKGFDTVLDIGTDHGFVLQDAFDLGLIKKGIAADIKEGPLNQAKENLKHYPVDFVLSDGFQAIDQPFDLAIIAGMGAYTIAEILDHVFLDVTYVLQANDKQDILRQYLMDHDYVIIDESVIYDGFYYVVMMVKKGKMSLDERDIYLGPVLQQKSESMLYYQHQLKTLSGIVNQADDEKKMMLERLIGYLKSVL